MYSSDETCMSLCPAKVINICLWNNKIDFECLYQIHYINSHTKSIGTVVVLMMLAFCDYVRLQANKIIHK